MSGDERVVLAGRLQKYCRFPCFRHWQTRVFVVYTDRFLYRHEKGGGIKEFSLEAIVDVQFKDAEADPVEFRVVLDTKTLRLRTRSLTQRNYWIACLRPKRRYSETHKEQVAARTVELSQFVLASGHRGRLLGSVLDQLIKRRYAFVWTRYSSYLTSH